MFQISFLPPEVATGESPCHQHGFCDRTRQPSSVYHHYHHSSLLSPARNAAFWKHRLLTPVSTVRPTCNLGLFSAHSDCHCSADSCSALSAPCTCWECCCSPLGQSSDDSGYLDMMEMQDILIGMLGKCQLHPSFHGEENNLYLDVSEQSPCPCLLYTSPSPRDRTTSRMPSSA